jgi:adenylate cyclase
MSNEGKTDHMEVERKFHLPEQPTWLGDHPSVAIAQGYLVIDDEVEVRLRAADRHRLLTVKRGHGESREEIEVQLSAEQFDALWPLTDSLRLRKRRFRVPVDGLTAEVDVFEGELVGLVLGEVEFDSTGTADRFEAPPWLGEEVTGDDRYANQTLARSGLPQGM